MIERFIKIQVIYLYGDNMVKVELEDGEEAIEKRVSRFGRIDGLTKWSGKRVKIILLKQRDDTP